jgi:predicted AAA+ superfamily ATPase
VPKSKPVSSLPSVDLGSFLVRAERVLAQLEAWLPPAPPAIDWNARAFRWRKRGTRGWLEPVGHIASIGMADLQHIDRQKQVIDRNTSQFLAGKPANNVLMTGARGTGKSSLVKAMLAAYADQGLRLVEVDKTDLADLQEIVEAVAARPERFIVFCDDLSFEEGEASYKALKSVLDGSIAAAGDNVLIYATSNRRHLMPEYMNENLQASHQADGEIHPGETVEEKISLSERFGLWLSFYPFKQDDYLDIVEHWLRELGCDDKSVADARMAALQWTLERGSRSGRVAWQFAKDWAAQHAPAGSKAVGKAVVSKVGDNEAPAAAASVAKTSIAKAPATKKSASKASKASKAFVPPPLASKASRPKTSVPKTPASKASARKTAALKKSASKTAVADAPVSGSSASNAPASLPPISQAIRKAPAKTSSARKSFFDEPAARVPARKSSRRAG